MRFFIDIYKKTFLLTCTCGHCLVCNGIKVDSTQTQPRQLSQLPEQQQGMLVQRTVGHFAASAHAHATSDTNSINGVLLRGMAVTLFKLRRVKVSLWQLIEVACVNNKCVNKL